MSIGTLHTQSRASLTVALVGAGRVGTELMRNLGLIGIHNVDVFERDRPAADPLRDRYTVVDGDFWDTLTLARLQEYDFAVCTIDDDDARSRMNRKCLLANVNLVLVGCAGSLAKVGAYPFGSHDASACAECRTTRPTAVPRALASLRLSLAETGGAYEATAAAAAAATVTTASVAGALAAALIVRIAAGAHGAIARTATLDATSGEGKSFEVQRDPHCPRCATLQRPVAIVQTRNRWDVSADLAARCPGLLDQQLQLSDVIDGLPHASCSIRELSERYHGGPIPAKFALTEIGGRTICLAFDECEPVSNAHGRIAAAAITQPLN